MNETPIQRKHLWNSLGNVTFKDWVKVADKLHLPVTSPNTGSSHYVIRKPTDPIDYTLEGVISTIHEGMSKQVNGKVFKRLLAFGIKEDDIWKALGKLQVACL